MISARRYELGIGPIRFIWNALQLIELACLDHKIFLIFVVCYFGFGTRDLSGREPLHSRGCWITHNDPQESVQFTRRVIRSLQRPVPVQDTTLTTGNIAPGGRTHNLNKRAGQTYASAARPLGRPNYYFLVDCKLYDTCFQQNYLYLYSPVTLLSITTVPICYNINLLEDPQGPTAQLMPFAISLEHLPFPYTSDFSLQA
jgi:hypothetical protein